MPSHDVTSSSAQQPAVQPWITSGMPNTSASPLAASNPDCATAALLVPALHPTVLSTIAFIARRGPSTTTTLSSHTLLPDGPTTILTPVSVDSSAAIVAVMQHQLWQLGATSDARAKPRQSSVVKGRRGQERGRGIVSRRGRAACVRQELRQQRSNRGAGGASDWRTTGPGLWQGGNREDGRATGGARAEGGATVERASPADDRDTPWGPAFGGKEATGRQGTTVAGGGQRARGSPGNGSVARPHGASRGQPGRGRVGQGGGATAVLADAEEETARSREGAERNVAAFAEEIGECRGATAPSRTCARTKTIA